MSAAQLQRIQSYLRVAAPRGRDHEQVGPFLATFNRVDVNPYLNYAIPDDRATPSPADVAALVDAYRARERNHASSTSPRSRPTSSPPWSPGGFTVEGRLPLMTYVGAEDMPAPE